MKTAEFVSPMHPDKICDLIADKILDAYLENDKNSRCAVEVMGGHKLVVVNGEVTSLSSPDIEKLVQSLVGEDFKVLCNLVKQSPQIAQGVDTGGAGDQGIMKGYATRETDTYMPLEYELARSLCTYIFEKHPYDGKTQVTIEDGYIKTVVASFQNVKKENLENLVNEWLLARQDLAQGKVEILANPAGDWTQGGFDADTGLSGRKLIVDNYGPEVAIGGGSFSGKDYTKVDRSGAYMARRIAVDLLLKHKAKEVHTKLAYAIGKAEPVMAVAIVDGVSMDIEGYDLTPRGIYKYLNLGEVEYFRTSSYGHFGRDLPWG